jgi:hypothetical protein
MNLTLSLATNGGATAKKRKLLRDSVVDDDDETRSCDGGDRRHGRVARLLLQAGRERVTAKLEADDGRLRLLHLLLSSVAAAEAGDASAAAAALHEVRRRASFRGGDPAQRVAAHFARALAASSLVVRSPPGAEAEASPPTRAERFLAHTMFYQASPIYQFAHFTANQAIVEAFQSGGGRCRRLHVVDLDVSYGFQWPSLIQSLSAAAASASARASTSIASHDGDEPVSLRITGFGTSHDELRRTEARLARFASGFPSLMFEFDGIVDDGPDSVLRDERIKVVDHDATVVVNLVLPGSRSSMTTGTRQKARSALLARTIRSLNPSLVFLVEKDGGGGGNNNATSRGTGRSSLLLPAFTASLRYFSAVFDSLHECLPADSAERLAIERDHLGVEISDAMACLDFNSNGGDDDHMAEPSWRQMMERSGLFEGVELSTRTVSQAKLLLKMKSAGCGGGGFRVVEGEGGRAMSLAWRDREQLITATGWRRRRPSIDHHEARVHG